VAVFSCASFRYVAISDGNPLEGCVPFARLNIAIIQTLTGGMRTHGTGRGGSTVQQHSLCRPVSQTWSGHVLRSWKYRQENKLHTSSIRIESFLKFMRNMYFSLFIPHTDVIFRQISKYGPHVSITGTVTHVLHFNTREAA
jgi:hypothetical protein